MSEQVGLHACTMCGVELDGDDPKALCEECAAEVAQALTAALDGTGPGFVCEPEDDYYDPDWRDPITRPALGRNDG